MISEPRPTAALMVSGSDGESSRKPYSRRRYALRRLGHKASGVDDDAGLTNHGYITTPELGASVKP